MTDTNELAARLMADLEAGEIQGSEVALSNIREAATALASQSAPAGWKMVPVTPNIDMMESMLGWRETDSRDGLTGNVDMFDRAWHRALAASPTPPQGAGESDPTQKDVLAWAVDTFGPVAKLRTERAMRLVEEAVEVAQTEGVDQQHIARIVDRTYSRPPGELWQELGGCLNTLLACAENAGIDLHAAWLREYERVTSKPKSEWQKKHAEKIDAGTAEALATFTAEKYPVDPRIADARATPAPDGDEALLKSAVEIHDDLIQRAKFKDPDDIVVAVSAGPWLRFCAAIQAALAQKEGGAVAERNDGPVSEKSPPR